MELYNSTEMPLSNNPERRLAQEKILNGEQLSLKDKIALGGHDHPFKNIGNYQLKPDHCYRAISRETFELYKQKGYIVGFSEYLGEVKELDGSVRVDNGGVDWYLGGASKRYGEIIIECPADKNYFVPAHDNGCGLSSDITVRHMKSSGINNPIPFSMITNAFDISKINAQEKVQFDGLRQLDMQQRSIFRQEQLNQIIKLNESEQLSSGGKSL